MGTALLICAVSLSTAVVVILLCRYSTGRQEAGLEQRFLRQLAEVEESHKTTVGLMQESSDQLVRTGSVYIDRLRADTDALRKQLADLRLAHELEVAELQEKIALLENADRLRQISDWTGRGGRHEAV